MSNKNADKVLKLDVTKILNPFADVNLRQISPTKRREIKELKHSIYYMIGGVGLILVFIPLIILGIPLFYYGYKKYKKLLPKLKRDLAPYRNTNKKYNERT